MQVGTPITVPSQGFVDLGRIASMELNHKVQCSVHSATGQPHRMLRTFEKKHVKFSPACAMGSCHPRRLSTVPRRGTTWL